MNEPPRHILIVCSGNTCRSPLGAAMLAARVASIPELQGVVVASAGTGAREGAPASEGSYLIALERGLDLSGHHARQVTVEIVHNADLILTMGAAHSRQVAELGGAQRVQLLTSFVGEAAVDVPDPYGEAIAKYRETAVLLDRLMAQVVERLRRGLAQ